LRSPMVQRELIIIGNLFLMIIFTSCVGTHILDERINNMKFTCSLFTKKIVEEELEVIQKALVIAHDYYASRGKYDDALKISDLLAGNQDEDGCFKFVGRNEIQVNDSIHQNTMNEGQPGSWFQLDDALGLIPGGWKI